MAVAGSTMTARRLRSLFRRSFAVDECTRRGGDEGRRKCMMFAVVISCVCNDEDEDEQDDEVDLESGAYDSISFSFLSSSASLSSLMMKDDAGKAPSPLIPKSRPCRLEERLECRRVSPLSVSIDDEDVEMGASSSICDSRFENTPDHVVARSRRASCMPRLDP